MTINRIIKYDSDISCGDTGLLFVCPGCGGHFQISSIRDEWCILFRKKGFVNMYYCPTEKRYVCSRCVVTGFTAKASDLCPSCNSVVIDPHKHAKIFYI